MVLRVELFSALVIVFLGSLVLCGPVNEEELIEFEEYLQSTRDGEPSEEFDEMFDQEGKQNVWELSGKFEGDIVLTDQQQKALLNVVAQPGLARNGLNDASKRWPGATLVYKIIERDFSSDQVSAIKDGMDDLSRISCLKFREKGPDDDDFVEIQGKRRGCFSQVGYLGRGKQLMNLTPHPTGVGCMRHGTIVHELLHSLGFFHMQSDTERDKYVKIEWDNIMDGRENNFKKYNSYEITDFGVPYDYDSVLHYSSYAFSKNGRKTIVPLSDGFVSLGQRTGLSDKDATKLNRMYKCDGDSSDDSPSKRDYNFDEPNYDTYYDDDDKSSNSDENEKSPKPTNNNDDTYSWGKYLFPEAIYDFSKWWTQ